MADPSLAFHAVRRFGTGPGPRDLTDAAHDPRGWLKAQIRPGAALPDATRSMAPTSEAMADAAIYTANDPRPSEDTKRALREAAKRRDYLASLRAASTSQTPYMERLVRFWTNHFCVSDTRNAVVLLAGAYERDAIRPGMDGTFRQLLGRVMRHPAMLQYLDNDSSIGPNSKAGIKSHKGLNENLGRELMELHTLGVNAGYTQADVTNAARILTGWTAPFKEGEFRYADNRHEPGDKSWFGTTIRSGGEKEGEELLDRLAAHPATARHIATKLATHFVADNPPQAAVDKLAKVYQQSGGDLPTLHKAIVDLDEAWSNPLAKATQPVDLVVGLHRAVGDDGADDKDLSFLGQLGQPYWGAPAPTGWPDTMADWFAPDALLRRIEWAQRMGNQYGGKIDGRDFAQATAGPLLTEAHFSVIRSATSARETFTLALLTPEFQRR